MIAVYRSLAWLFSRLADLLGRYPNAARAIIITFATAFCAFCQEWMSKSGPMSAPRLPQSSVTICLTGNYCFGAVRSASASGPRFLYIGCPQEASMAMLVEQFTLLGLTPQNWMIVTLAMIVIAALISRMENG